MKIALIGPSFFGYLVAVRDAFRSRGHRVEAFDERRSNSIISKILCRTSSIIGQTKIQRQHVSNIINEIIYKKFTHVVIVSCETLSRDDVLKLKSSGVVVFCYMWDAIENKKNVLSYLGDLDGVASFDPADCVNYKMKYLPLFAEDLFQQNAASLINQPSYDIVLCGTIHSKRLHYSIKIISDFASGKFILKTLLYYYSMPLLVFRCLLNPSTFKIMKHVSFSGYSKEQISDVFKKSRFVLDIPHPKQSGLTSRTFEALRAGCVLVTFNKSVAELPKRLRERCFLINDIDQVKKIVEDTKNYSNERGLSSELDYYTSIDRFIDELVGELMNTLRGDARLK